MSVICQFVIDIQTQKLSESDSSGNNFDQLGGNSSLSCFIVLKSNLFENFFGILGCVLHCIHSCWLLRSGIMEESNPKVWCQVKFVKSWVRSILIRKSLVVELSELHGFEESLFWHQFHMSCDVWNGGFEFVGNNNNFISILSHLRNMNSHGHNGWIIVWSTNVGDRGLKQIWEWSGQTSSTLITNSENLCFRSDAISSFNVFFNFSNNWRVNSTAKTFIRGDWDDDNSCVLCLCWHFSLHKLITLEDHIDSFITEIFTSC